MSERTEAAIGYINIGLEEIDDPRRETSIEIVRNALCNARSVLQARVDGTEGGADAAEIRFIPMHAPTEADKRFWEFYEALRAQVQAG